MYLIEAHIFHAGTKLWRIRPINPSHNNLGKAYCDNRWETIHLYVVSQSCNYSKLLNFNKKKSFVHMIMFLSSTLSPVFSLTWVLHMCSLYLTSLLYYLLSLSRTQRSLWFITNNPEVLNPLPQRYDLWQIQQICVVTQTILSSVLVRSVILFLVYHLSPCWICLNFPPTVHFDSAVYFKTHCQLSEIPSENNTKVFALQKMSSENSRWYVMDWDWWG